MRNWTKEEIKRYLGEDHGCWITYSTDDQVRNGAASGGTTSQILVNLLDRGLIDGALVWKMVLGGDHPTTEALIATTREQVLEARGSKYAAVRYARDGLPLIESFEGRLAVVTVPCDASYLRRKMHSDPALADKIVCILTLFCGHNSEPGLTEMVVRQHGLEWGKLDHFRHRTGLWRGEMSFGDGEGIEVSVPTKKFTHYQNLHFFSERKCLNCVDHYGFDGDICTGDIWSRKEKSSEHKPTLVVAKTERGRALWEQARENVTAREVDSSYVVNGNSRGMTFHYNVTARARVGKLFGIHIRDKLHLPVTTLDLAAAFICLFNFSISRHHKSKRWVPRIPFFLIRIYVYLFKGLQQLNLLFYRPFPPSPKVAIVGATLTGNRGAEAMLVTTIGRVRDFAPDVRFVVMTYYPGLDRKLCKDLDVEVVSATPWSLVTRFLPFSIADRISRLFGARLPRWLLPRGPRELSEASVLLDIAGVSFCDGREKFLPFNFLNNWPAMLFGVPVVKLSQAMGSFNGALVRHTARFVLRRCERVFARGDVSLTHCRELGLSDRVETATDIAFSFREADSLTVENEQDIEDLVKRARSLSGSRGTIAIAISAVVHQKSLEKGTNYVAETSKVVRLLLDEGFNVIVMPNAIRSDTDKLHNNDLPVLAGIRRALADSPSDRLLVVEADINTAGLRRILKIADVLIASRFHSMIAGLALEMPVMVVGWGHKYEEVLSQFGCAEWAVGHSSLESEALVQRVLEFWEQREPIRAKVRDNLESVRRASLHQFEWLAEFLRPDLSVQVDDCDE